MKRLEALKAKLEQLEEEPWIYHILHCPMCDVCIFKSDEGCGCIEYIEKEAGVSFRNPSFYSPYGDYWLIEFERRFWISHCLREIKTEALMSRESACGYEVS